MWGIGGGSSEAYENNSGGGGGGEDYNYYYYYDNSIRLGLAATLASFVLLAPPAFVLSHPNPLEGTGAVFLIWFGFFGVLMFGFAVNFYLVAITNRPDGGAFVRRSNGSGTTYRRTKTDEDSDDANDSDDGEDGEDDEEELDESSDEADVQTALATVDLTQNDKAQEYSIVRTLRSFVFILCNRTDSKLSLSYWRDPAQGFKEKEYDMCIELLEKAGVITKPGAGAAPRFAEGYSRQSQGKIWDALNELCGYKILQSLEASEGTKVYDWRTRNS